MDSKKAFRFANAAMRFASICFSCSSVSSIDADGLNWCFSNARCSLCV